MLEVDQIISQVCHRTGHHYSCEIDFVSFNHPRLMGSWRLASRYQEATKPDNNGRFRFSERRPGRKVQASVKTSGCWRWQAHGTFVEESCRHRRRGGSRCAKVGRTKGVGLPRAVECQVVTPRVPDTGMEQKGLVLACWALVLPLPAMSPFFPFKMEIFTLCHCIDIHCIITV